MSYKPAVAYKILTAEQMTELLREGSLAGAPVDLADGYIHLSTARQLAATLDKHFAGQDGLHLAAIDLAALGSAVRWEPARGDDLFPHLYSRLPLDAVIAHGPLARGGNGAIDLPGAD